MVKILIGVLVLVSFIFLLDAAFQFLHISTIEKMGFISLAAAPITANVAFANEIIILHASLLNSYSNTEELASYTAFKADLQFNMDSFNLQQEASIESFNAEYCALELALGQGCNPVVQVDATFNFQSGSCKQNDIVPIIYTAFNQPEYELEYEENLNVYVVAARSILINTLWAIFVVATILFTVSGLGSLLWHIFMRMDLLLVHRTALVNAADWEKLKDKDSNKV